MSHSEKFEECCNQFNPSLWDEKTHHWTDKLFLKDSFPQIFHFPLPTMYKRTINRLWKQVQQADAAPERNEFLLLAHDPTPWKAVLYMLVKHEVPRANNVRLSGTFISKVFNGPFYKIPQYLREMEEYLTKQNTSAVKYYFYFATCPACAKKYGYNYIVAFAEV
ncbi:MAG: hypothetical protein EHM20_10700 [Alphaproteobacteria bacterium]|nr:MAG: hypothetical protein EHM20_10700 [Alphaproteobacteria bacterium]